MISFVYRNSPHNFKKQNAASVGPIAVIIPSFNFAKKAKGNDGTVARVKNEKAKQHVPRNTPYIDAEAMIGLKKYDDKLMNAIWGRYNR